MCVQVRGELQEEKEEKVDLVTEKVKAEEELAALRDLSSQVTRPRFSYVLTLRIYRLHLRAFSFFYVNIACQQISTEFWYRGNYALEKNLFKGEQEK